MKPWMKWTLLAIVVLGPVGWFLVALAVPNGRPKSSAARKSSALRLECAAAALPHGEVCFDVIDGFVRERSPGDVAPTRH